MTTLPAPHDNAFVLIVHDVEDYGKWKHIFDNAAVIRRAAGEIEYQLLASESDARRVVHFSRWTSLAAARSFFESPECWFPRRTEPVFPPRSEPPLSMVF